MPKAVGTKNARLTVPMVRRIQALHASGVPATSIVKVITLDYGECPCEQTVRKYTAEGVLA